MKRALVIGTLVTAGLVLACDDDAMGPNTKGSISIRIVVGQTTNAAASQAAVPAASRVATAPGSQSKTAGESQEPTVYLGPARSTGDADAHDARKGTNARVTQETAAGETKDAEEEDEAAPTAPSAIDDATLRVIGPTNVTRTGLSPGETVTVENLTVGSYTLVVEGFLSGEVDHFAITTGVQVRSGQETTATVTFNSFRPVLNAVTTPTTDIPFAFSWPAVQDADGYIVELDDDVNFTAPLIASAQITGTAAVASVVQAGTYYVRARAVNSTYVAGGGGASGSQSVDVIEDVVSGPDPANPAYQGFMDGLGPYVVTDVNILPVDDQDWFSADACELDTLVVETFAGRLVEPSPLDTYLEVWDPTATTMIAENDDIDAANLDSYVEAEVGSDGEYLITVFSASSNSAGSYELSIDVKRGPNNDGSRCTTQSVAEVIVAPSGASISGIGATQLLNAQAFDSVGSPIVGASFTWTSLNPDIAIVDGSGSVTAVDVGQVAISAETGGVAGYALVTVTDPTATPVSIWAPMSSPTTEELYGVWGSSGSNVFAVGTGGTILRFDGTSWITMNSGTTTWLADVWGAAANDVYAVGAAGTILHYNGSTWSPMTSGVTGLLYRVWGSGPNDVFAVGETGTIVHWDGSAWTTMTSSTTQLLVGVWGTASDDVFAVGLGNTILHFDGSVWIGQTAPSTGSYYDLWGESPGNVFLVGFPGEIASYDGGSWTSMTSPTTTWLWSVWGTSDSDLYALGGSGTMVQYNGASWSVMPNPTSSDLRGIWGTRSGDVFAVGQLGTILRGGSSATAVEELTIAHNMLNTAMSVTTNGSSYWTINGGVSSQGVIEEYDLSGTFVDSVALVLDSRGLFLNLTNGGFYTKPFGQDWELIDPNTGARTPLLTGIFTSVQSSPAITTDGMSILEHDPAGTVRVLDFATGALNRTITGLSGAWSLSVATAGDYLFTASTGTVFVYDLQGNFITSVGIPNGNNQYSLSYANGLIWVEEGGIWYGYRLVAQP
jgi:hypothetical protein